MTLTLLTTKIPNGYFSQKNVNLIRNEITKNLSFDFEVPIIIDDSSIRRVMQRVLEERLESIDRMLIRVVMEIINEYKTYQLERIKHLRWERYFPFTQKIVDISSSSGPDMQTIKLSRACSTLRFHHTYSI